MADMRFDIGDDLSISDLRKVDEWEPRLLQTGKLRVQRRGEVVGVLLSPDEWRALKDRTENYEEALRDAEDERDRMIVAARESGPLMHGKKLANALERELKKEGLL